MEEYLVIILRYVFLFLHIDMHCGYSLDVHHI